MFHLKDAGAQEDGSQSESGCKAPPDAVGFKAAGGGEEPADGDAKNPVRDESGPGGNFDVFESAKISGGNNLQAVEELEEGHDDEELRGQRNNGFVVDVEAGDEFVS